MPKKRSIHPGFGKRLQRLYNRVAAGPSLPEPEAPNEAPAPAMAVANVPRTHTDVERLMAAEAKRARKARRRLALDS